MFYTPADHDTRLSEVNVNAEKTYHKSVQEAVKSGALTTEQAALREKNFHEGNIGPWVPKAETNDNPSLITLREMENERFCLNHMPQQCADGLYRPVDFYVSPGHLDRLAETRNWDMKDGVPVADAIVVGGGPAGLSTSYQLARRGGRVVCFESELAGSAFSDNTAKAVHHMRTSVSLTNLVRDGYFNEDFNRAEPLSLHGQIASYRPHAKAGRDSQLELTGEPIYGVPPECLDIHDENSPATRGELYEHLSSLAYSLANDFDDAVLAERSPVNNITYEDGLFTVTTARGHKVKAKHLVMSTGLTGPQGERGRMLPIFDELAAKQPGSYTLLGKDGDSLRECEKMDLMGSSQERGCMVVNDRLLGDQAVRQTIQALPEGTRAAVVGSGESAIKGALELAHLHPGLKVDLFVKDTLESAQVQLPNENFHPAVQETTQENPEKIAQAKETFRVFGTPVTPRSLQELFEMQQTGQVRVIELGGYFDKNTMELTPMENGTTKLHITDEQMARTVDERAQSYKAKGLMPSDAPGVDGSEYGLFIQSVGYTKQRKEDNPLAKLGEEAQKHIFINTAGAAIHPAQTSMPGLATRGRHIAEEIAAEIPEDRRVEVEKHPTWAENVDAETVDGIIANRGLHPDFVKAVEDRVKRNGSDPQEIRLTLPSDDNRLRDLAAIPPEQRTPAEQEVLDRGLLLANRMKEYAKEHNS